MKKYIILRNVCIVLALMLSYAMCVDVTFNYASMLCAIEHKGFSAPASIAYFFAIPYVSGIVLCVILALVFNKMNNNTLKR